MVYMEILLSVKTNVTKSIVIPVGKVLGRAIYD